MDLRYRVEDNYAFEASNPGSITFLVKSTDDWSVEGNADWYTISPSSGPAGETVTVTLTPKENTSLDDRSDEISIKSDYWTGKKFTIFQKGTAYLRTVTENMLVSKEAQQQIMKVESNQKWSAVVPEEYRGWIQIVGSPDGEKDGEITLSLVDNTGEQREGSVTFLDRNGEAKYKLVITQDGVLLVPIEPENGSWYRLYDEVQDFIIPVEANGRWRVEMMNAKDDWFSFPDKVYDGSADLVLSLTQNEGAKTRDGYINLVSVSDDPSTEPVVKRIHFKQANKQIPQVKEGWKGQGDKWLASGQRPGRYNFYFEPTGSVNIQIFYMIPGGDPYVEIRQYVINGKTQVGSTPWSGEAYLELERTHVDVPTSKSYVLGFDINEGSGFDPDHGSWIETKWYLNDVLYAQDVSEGMGAGGTSDTWKVPFSRLNQNGFQILIRANAPVTLAKWEYIAPIVWGD